MRMIDNLKLQQSAEIAKDVDKFLASGGKIEFHECRTAEEIIAFNQKKAKRYFKDSFEGSDVGWSYTEISS